METETIPSRAERVYAVLISVMVPLLFALIWINSYLNNRADTTAFLREETLYWLAYMGSIAVAVGGAKMYLPDVIGSIRSHRINSLVRIGLPLFLATTCFNWAFPSHVKLIEHIAFNLVLALYCGWTWPREVSTSPSLDTDSCR
jgi:hypothetical protein